MEISDDARKFLENRVTRILKQIDIPDRDKAEIRDELLSNYADASIVKARSRGAEVADLDDARSVLMASEDPEEIASAYMMSYTESLDRAGLISRAAAFFVDYVLSSACAFVLTTPFFAFGAFLGRPVIFPPLMPFVMQYFNLILTMNLAVVFIYFVISEGFFGYTPGKWILGLKVLREDGRKAGYVEAIVRNISKVFIIAIIADSLLIPVDKANHQRMFDRIARTIVIHRM